MPSYDQLGNEAAWHAEAAAPALKMLGDRLRGHWPGAQIGIRGNNVHLSGYHRSRRWIKESRFCENRTYSVSRTPGDKSGGDSNWACAMDFGGIPQADLLAVCKRLDAAVRAGRLEKITEWYGNFGGDNRVDGWDNISNRIATSDSSHLTHLHMSFDRGRANEDHSDVLAVLIGDEDDMTPEQANQLNSVFQAVFFGGGSCGDWRNPSNGLPKSNSVVNKLDHLGEKVETLAVPALTDAQLATIATTAGEHAAALIGGKLDALLAEVRRASEAEKAGLQAELDKLKS